MARFRFEDMEIWKMSISIVDELFEISNTLDNIRMYRIASQLRSAGLSISNNIAEGAGSFSKKEFAHFLNMARRSIFECVNIIIILLKRELISTKQKNELYEKLDFLSRRITRFRKTLL